MERSTPAPMPAAFDPNAFSTGTAGRHTSTIARSSATTRIDARGPVPAKRRTFISLLDATGAPYGVVKSLARHSKRSDMTFRYLSPDDARLRAALELLVNHVLQINVIQMKAAVG